jgi:hypothetical protein
LGRKKSALFVRLTEKQMPRLARNGNPVVVRIRFVSRLPEVSEITQRSPRQFSAQAHVFNQLPFGIEDALGNGGF